MKNAERFTTPELKEQEQAILHAEEQSIAREQVLFQELIQAILSHSVALKATAEAIAQIDVLIGFANKAREWDYCKPTLDKSNRLSIEQGRHPVVEQMLKESPSVSQALMLSSLMIAAYPPPAKPTHKLPS